MALDLIDRVSEELWTEVHDTVQETGIKNIPMEKKCEKAERLSGRPHKYLWKKEEKRKDISI